MSIDIRCDRCRRLYVFSDDKRGQRIWCKVCGNALTPEARQSAVEMGAPLTLELCEPAQTATPPPLPAPPPVRIAPAAPNRRLGRLAVVWAVSVLFLGGIGLAIVLLLPQSEPPSISPALEISIPTPPAIPPEKMNDSNDNRIDPPPNAFQFTGLPASIRRHLPAPVLQPPPLTPTGPWTYLLTDQKLVQNVLAGKWTSDEGKLTCNSNSGHEFVFARFSLGAPPAACYELEMTVNRRAGHKEFFILLPAGRPGQIALGGMDGQSSEIRGGSKTDGANGNLLINNKDQQLDITVRLYGDQVAIDVYLDARPYLRWAGPQSHMSYPPFTAMDDPNAIGLAAHPADTIDFKDIRVRPLTRQSP